MQDLINKRIELTQKHLDNIKLLEKQGIAKAEAERDYRIALAKRELELRANGIPVSILSDLARGTEEIAILKCNRDIAISTYEAIQLNINKIDKDRNDNDSQIEAERKGL